MLEFFSTEAMQPDRGLLQALVHIGIQLGHVVERQRMTERLRRNLADQQIIAAIMRIALAPLSLDEILEQTLAVVLSNHGLGLESKGCIFLMDESGSALVMRAQRGLAAALLDTCAKVAFGRCLCGRAAETGQLVHVDHVDSRHDITFPGIIPHGHYCVPIQGAGEVLGVLNLYIPEGHAADEDEIHLVSMVADRLAGVIRRKRVEEALRRSEEKYRSVTQSASDAIIAIDNRGTIVSWNEGARVMFGYEEADVVGSHLTRVIPERYQAVHIEGLKRMCQDRAGHRLPGRPLELNGRRRNGDDFPVELTIGSWTVGDDVFYSVIVRDATERKRTETALRKAKEQAEVASRAKSEFLANVSHELRTPLNAILGFSEILAGEMLGPIGRPEYAGYARDIHQSGKNLLALISDILDVSRIEADALELMESEIDVAQVVASCHRLIKERADRARLRLESTVVEPLPTLHADDRLIKQVLLNLLSNAIKFTPEGGIVTTGARLDEDGCLLLAVSDTGIGIAPEDFETVMAPFGQVDGSLARKYQGAGLGLPLSKRLVELHGGTLVLDSMPGLGTTVTVRLPRTRLAASVAVESSG